MLAAIADHRINAVDAKKCDAYVLFPQHFSLFDGNLIVITAVHRAGHEAWTVAKLAGAEVHVADLLHEAMLEATARLKELGGQVTDIRESDED
jgi:hypothetical protein